MEGRADQALDELGRRARAAEHALEPCQAQPQARLTFRALDDGLHTQGQQGQQGPGARGGH
ncbi:hypothetical protein OG599_34415 [Streptomyces sp. NBC_01335]|uniref:hypothetical protein n=1 Tax=Streptomyces sp. NBC_01335 TaxID=2903828 RepID=UPI002E0D8E7E|nr:hypothetical protein OG599_00035 [Streptomyces sp. NBC_01335]WSI74766.1 hypothetical protein OG599_34415 [Streptomyces sp. NBC_01335]